MTVPMPPTSTNTSRNGTSHHRHTQSGSAVVSLNASTPNSKRQPLHTVHNSQSPPPRANMVDPNTSPKTPNADGAKSKKRKPRKPKDKNSPDRSNANASDSTAASQSSPARSPPTRQTTPTKVATTPGKAYAGPTFHHSPAPSSLPIPKFFSRSVPSSKSRGLRAMMEDDDTATTDESQASSPALDNPLELLFKAHREEKARINRQSADISDTDSTPDTFGRDIFGMDPESPVRNAFNTPRYNGARSGAQRSVTDPMFSMDSLNASLPSSPVQPATHRYDDAERLAKSAALRQLLFQQPGVSPPPFQVQTPYQMSGTLSPPPSSRPQFEVSPQGSPIPQRHQAHPTNINSRPPLPKAPRLLAQQNLHPRVPLQESSNLSSSASRFQFEKIFENKSAALPCMTESRDFTAMENSLRQILKLDPPGMSGGVMI